MLFLDDDVVQGLRIGYIQHASLITPARLSVRLSAFLTSTLTPKGPWSFTTEP